MATWAVLPTVSSGVHRRPHRAVPVLARTARWSPPSSPCPRSARSKGLALFAGLATYSAEAQRSRLGGAAGPAIPWPDVRLWVQKLPDGTARVSRSRSADAFLAFDAYSQPMPGTREVRLGDLRFFAFVGPRLGAEHLVIWRTTADVQAKAEEYQAAAAARTASSDADAAGADLELLQDARIRLTKCSDKAQLTAAVWRWEKLDERDPHRYWEVGEDAWMYWESFWAPSEDAALALEGPAFGDRAGAMLQPTLPASTLLVSPAKSSSILSQDLPGGDEQDRIARAAMKDKAYSIVYEYNVWGSDVSRSGTGSDLWSPEARLAVTALEAVVDAFEIRSMLDCACGDATWMVPFFVARHPEIDYTGVDVVSEVVEQNRQRHPAVKFLAQETTHISVDSTGDPDWHHKSLEVQTIVLKRFNASPDFDVLKPFDPRAASTTAGAPVPGSVDVAPPGKLGRRGVAMYRTHFVQNGRFARLQFMGCSFYCRVFVDGKEVGEHRAGGFVPWFLDLDAADLSGTAGGTASSRSRELFLLVDNRFNATTAPMHTGGDFWHYGGLVRSVLLHDLPEDSQTPYVWRAQVLPKSLDEVDVYVTLTSKFNGFIRCQVAFDENEPALLNATAVNGKFSFHSLRVPQPRVWSLQTPQLHTLRLSTFGAETIERFGLRLWGTSRGRLTLNGEEVKLHGWNHHTQWLDTGASPTAAQLDGDLALLRNANANFVRGAHYPQDQRWLDRLDEEGLAMWEETLGPQVKVENTLDWNYFMKYQLQQMEEMMEASMNHPSIMVWAWFNEGPSNDPRACPAYAACAQVASRDPTRLRSWASNKKDQDRCLSHATAVSFNSYPAWYHDVHDLNAPRREWSASIAWAKEKFPEKPFFISETGAGGLFEWKNQTDAYWTLKYQQEVIDRDVDVALENANVSGLTLWHFFDFKGNDEAQACGPCHYEAQSLPPTCAWYNLTGDCAHRSGGLNHKGVVDAYRRKKPAFDSVKAKYGRPPSSARPSLVVDLSELPLPRGAQLIFSKETVNHMHLEDALRAIQRFAQTGARYLLTNVHEGVDNFVGAQKTCHTTYIKYDYELPPFSLPKVVRVIEYQGLETSYTLFKLNSE
ncbi:unnamed protein product [Durusdinium trenchii]|uniref:Glycoside hydrolase family 2 catalytic domain-containing protein n=1 Tax=Durusdinium trenchii TaxID=1381693 RepID=A0ABP0RJX0_9DINO